MRFDGVADMVPIVAGRGSLFSLRRGLFGGGRSEFSGAMMGAVETVEVEFRFVDV